MINLDDGSWGLGREEKEGGNEDMRGAEGASLVTQMVKNLSAMQETRVQSLGQEDPLEKGMATHSSILAWRSHGQRSLVGCSPWGR